MYVVSNNNNVFIRIYYYCGGVVAFNFSPLIPSYHVAALQKNFESTTFENPLVVGAFHESPSHSSPLNRDFLKIPITKWPQDRRFMGG